MKGNLRVLLLSVLSVALLVSGCSGKPAATSTVPVTLNVATAGDTNMADLQTQVVGKDFSATHPGVSINVIGTGPGDAGSEKIYEKLKAQKDAGKTDWDVDVAIVHQSIMGKMLQDDLLEKYVPMSADKGYVTSPDSKNSLGTNIDGYAIPMFHSQVAIAYNPDKVKDVPQDFASLVAWIKANPQRFGYNGVKNGMSGVSLVTGYTYWKTGDYKQLSAGPFDPSLEKKWPDILKELKALPATITTGNNDTLDKLNRGEIDMGAVWVDMFVLWQNQGRMNPAFKEKLIAPGLPGQPMYIVIPKNAKNKGMALKYADYLASPAVQATAMVEYSGWYPGIDPNAVLPQVSDAGKKKLFTDITADELVAKGQSFPLAQYLSDLNTAYGKN